MDYKVKAFSDYGKVAVNDNTIRFVADNEFDEAFFSMKFEFTDWEQDAHILMPIGK